MLRVAFPRDENSTTGRTVERWSRRDAGAPIFAVDIAADEKYPRVHIQTARRFHEAADAKLAHYTLLTLTIGAFAASAQISTQIVFRMSRPFVVGNTTFPEGNFVIREVPGAAKLTLEFSNPRGGASTKVEAQSIPADPTIHAAEIAFNKYATLMALSQVFPGTGKHGYQLVPGQAERDAAKTEKPLRQTIPAHGS